MHAWHIMAHTDTEATVGLVIITAIAGMLDSYLKPCPGEDLVLGKIHNYLHTCTPSNLPPHMHTFKPCVYTCTEEWNLHGASLSFLRYVIKKCIYSGTSE